MSLSNKITSFLSQGKILKYFKKHQAITQKNNLDFFKITSIFLAASIVDIVGIGIVSPLIMSISDPVDLQNTINTYTGILIDKDKVFIYLAALTIVLFVFKNSLSLFVQAKIISFAFLVRSDITQRLAKKYLNLPILYHQENNVSVVIQKIQGHTNYYIDLGLIPVLRGIAEFFVMIAIVLFLIYLSPLIMTSAFFILGFIIISYNVIFKNIYRRNGERDLAASEEVIRTMKEAVQGIREVKVLQKEPYFLKKIRDSSIERANAAIRVATLTVCPKYLLEVTLVLFIIFIASMYIKLDNSTDTMAILGVFAIASFRMIPSINAISIMLSQTSISTKAVNDLYIDLNNLEDCNLINKSDTECDDINNLVEIKDLHYKINGKSILNGVSFNIRKGDFIGIVGKSGSGKTTLLHLVANLLSPTTGVIAQRNPLIKNKKIVNNISLVDQETAILNDTLRNNIAFGCDASSIDDKKIVKAMSLSGLSVFHENLKLGLDHNLSDSGLNISGGERQRIGLARAIYANKDLLLLDEPSSALDKHNTETMLDTLVDISRSKGVLVISHNRDFLRYCNKVYEINNGRLTLVKDQK
jgi:ABC-type bacteriocin/lantibiotic exporter with double-glycine peptidase domain